MPWIIEMRTSCRSDIGAGLLRGLAEAVRVLALIDQSEMIIGHGYRKVKHLINHIDIYWIFLWIQKDVHFVFMEHIIS